MPKAADQRYEAVIAYVPVIHRGYLNFFEKFSNVLTIGILSSELLAEVDYLRKELRAITPEQAVQLLGASKTLPKCKLIGRAELQRYNQETAPIVMPDEDVSRHIAEHYLPQSNVKFYPVFLRWDRQAVEHEGGQEDLPETTDAVDEAFMQSAYAEAAHSSDIWRRVGAVIVKDGQLILKGVNQSLSTQNTPWAEGDPRIVYQQGAGIEMSTFMHAEAVAIASAARAGISLEGCSMYVTTFPCPPCAMLIAKSGISRCIFAEGYALLDGARVLREAGVRLSHITFESPRLAAELVPYPTKKH